MNLVNENIDIERQAFADLAKEISLKKLVENREEHDRYPFGELFSDVIKDAGMVGFYGVNLSPEYNGVGMNTGMVAVILDKISEIDASLAGIVFVNAAALEIINAASENTGDMKIYNSIKSIGTVPIAFPAYANPAEIDMPKVNPGHTAISGKIDYLVLGSIADYAVIPARIQNEKTYSYYLVDLKSDKIVRSKPVVSLGMHACPAVDITMDNAPAKLIGTAGMGEIYFDKMRQGMSVCSSAISLGIMRGSFNDALKYTADRYQGGRQIIDWGQVRMMLANMAIELKIAESCQNMVYLELDSKSQGWEKTAKATAIHIGELAIRVTTDGVQLFGGNGYTRDYPQEKRMRDARQAQSLLGMVLFRKIDYIGRIIEEVN